MNNIRKVVTAAIVGLLSSCGMTNASFANVGEFRSASDSTGHTILLHSEEGKNCGVFRGYMAERVNNSTQRYEVGCWTLNDKGTAIEVWWPGLFDVQVIYPTQVILHPNN